MNLIADHLFDKSDIIAVCFIFITHLGEWRKLVGVTEANFLVSPDHASLRGAATSQSITGWLKCAVLGDHFQWKSLW